jgi:hypothetical protein
VVRQLIASAGIGQAPLRRGGCRHGRLTHDVGIAAGAHPGWLGRTLAQAQARLIPPRSREILSRAIAVTYRRAAQPPVISPPRPRYEGNESCLTIANAHSPNPIVTASATAMAGSIPKDTSTTNTLAAIAAAVT